MDFLCENNERGDEIEDLVDKLDISLENGNVIVLPWDEFKRRDDQIEKQWKNRRKSDED